MTSRPTILITMPTGGQIATATVKSLIGLTQALPRAGIGFAIETYEFSDIVFSRNQLMSSFLSKPGFSHMLCLDSDMEFSVDAVMRLIDFDAPFTSTAYPQKHPNWEVLRRAFEADAHLPPDERRDTGQILAASWTYNHQNGAFPECPWQPRTRDGFRTVPAVGMGMVCVDRSVPEMMVATGAARDLPRNAGLPIHKGLRYHDFFSHRTSTDGKFLYAEDQSFCHRWVVDCGQEIWMDTESAITHWGQRSFYGKFADKLVAEKIDPHGPTSALSPIPVEQGPVTH